ncbi:MAG: ATP-binding protein [Anaerolineales bacterium]|nr:ATP-binding protein [Anaerolineales bacterium]
MLPPARRQNPGSVRPEETALAPDPPTGPTLQRRFCDPRRKPAHTCTHRRCGVFGLPGVGKTHFAAAVGHQLVQAGHSVLFTPTFHLVDELLRAKRDLLLERELRHLDTYEVLILDDIGYVQQSRDEMEVLFTLLAERYERRSVIITSNLVFSQWEQIFKDPMTTAAAIDRVVHHSIIVEFGKEIPSHRAQQAAKRIQQEPPPEYFFSACGGRRGLAPAALHTPPP